MRKLILLFVAVAVGCGPTSGGHKKGGGDDASTSGDTSVVFPTDSTVGPDAEAPGDTSTPPKACQPGEKSCSGNATIACAADGSGFGPPEPCPEGKVCGQGACIECKAGSKFCQGQTPVECDDGGQPKMGEPCAGGTSCANGVCVACVPGKKECRVGPGGEQETWECAAVSATAADWKKTATCPESADCVNGLCLDPCASDVKLNTNQGCDYYAVDLENSTSEPFEAGAPTAADAQFAVIVSNPNGKTPITVTVHETQKGPAIVTKQIGPQSLAVIKLDKRNVTGTVKDFLAWRIKADHPFIAYQFNPLDNVNPVYSNDATLLLPVNALGKDYLVMTGSGGGSYLTVIGAKANTKVTVTVTAPTDAGDGIPALAAGETFTDTLDAGEVLNIRAKKGTTQAETLTGSEVTADQNVLVFGGNVATTTGERCCADHLEMQLFPTQSWGTSYVAGKAQPRGVEPDYWRILARDDGTTVSFSGGTANQKKLDRGQYFDLATTEDFVVSSDKPILVGQFLASSFEVEPEGVWCSSDNQCSGGVCAGPETGAGQCLDGCNADSSACAPGEVCADNALFGEDSAAPAGSATCVHGVCGAPGLPKCAAGSSCIVVPGDADGRCYEGCSGMGGCTSAIASCSPTQFGDLCLEQTCFSNGECGGGWCNPATDPSQDGGCMKKCAVAQKCKKPGDVCLPVEFNKDPSVGKDLCVTTSGCHSDSDCDSGHTCRIPKDPDTGKDAAYGSCEPIGDPSFMLAVPTQQYRTDYVFLTPDAYKQNYVNILAPSTAFVTMDGSNVPADAFKSVTGTTWMVARLPAPAGVHTIKATAPVGIIVYGYHKDVSYGYPGGANLFDLGE